MKNTVMKLVVTLLVVGFLFGFFLVQQSNEARNSGEVTIQVIYTDDLMFEEVLTFKVGDTLMGLLITNYEIEYISYLGLGRMITKIRDLQQTQNAYIMIFVDGELSSVGIDLIELEDGIVVSFKLIKNN